MVRLELEDRRRTTEGVDVQMSFDELGTNLRDVTFVVVDLETTGGAPGAEEITEIGAVKTLGGEVTGEFGTLVNPNQPIPPFITVLTGITTAMVHRAPRIMEVLPAFLEFLGSGPDTVLVAHNARFDVSHLKAAAEAMGLEFPKVKVLDTVLLARRTFAKEEVGNYKLSSLARACGTEIQPTHRALDDARATNEILHIMLGRLGPLGVTHVEDLTTVMDPVPYKRRKRAHLADGLPPGPGVYEFIGPGGEVLYVGTSVNVRKRVRQYFTAAEKRRRIGEMVDLSVRVEATACATRLEAQVLELRRIEEVDPPYNRRSRNPAHRPWLTLTNEPHPRLAVVKKIAPHDVSRSLGPFTSTSQARRARHLVESASELRTCTRKLSALPRANSKACHLLDLGQCSAPCITGERQQAVSVVEEAMAGNLDALVATSSAAMGRMAEREEFERAADERDRLAATLSGARRRERLAPLVSAPEIRAAKRVDNGWDVIVLRYGRLVTSGTCGFAREVVAVADQLALSIPPAPAPPVACGAAPVEETELLAAWLWSPHTRIVAMDAPSPLSVPRHSVARHDVTVPREGERN